MLKQVSNYFGDVLQFLEENVNLSHATRRNQLDIFENPHDLQDLLLKLAAVVDAGIHFVKSTYSLEGDSPLIFSSCEHLSAVAQAVGEATTLASWLLPEKLPMAMLPSKLE